MLALTDHAGLSEEALAGLKAQLSSLTTLQAVVGWAFSLSPPSDVADVVIQDEYTHDVVLPWNRVWLVFDTT
ncbi:MAG TPA: hypothetical protein VK447_01770 [Myxococcaceae bacterium]|nr:hypothetical protein [Myxococcaceae bacterium]